MREYSSRMDAFAHDRYELRRKFFSPIHTDFTFSTAAGQAVLFGRKKGFKLKEDIRLYADEGREREVLVIAARSVIDFSGNYDVSDPQRGRVGVLRRKGLRSILRDEWHILDANEQQIATVQEDSQMMALLRRFLSNLIPQSFHVIVGARRWPSFASTSIRSGSAIRSISRSIRGVLLTAVWGSRWPRSSERSKDDRNEDTGVRSHASSCDDDRGRSDGAHGAACGRRCDPAGRRG